ncbi:MAG: DHA2 family efflux MFS transporter permease subunit [Nitrospirae bacterium]|nr:DHA2 family efflux MFS transporter permease subunit [Candidatus Manganitrophaceae bacterium]
MADPARTPHPSINPWVIAITVMSSTFMEILDTTVVNVSLPHIAGNLSATVDESTWVLTSYLVANAIILPLTGWLANFFGRKRFLIAAVAGFTAASFLCGLAPNLQTLILFRIIQGAAGGALQPLSQAILLEAFPPEGRGKAMGFWGLGVVTAPILGPVLGGWLTDNYSWRWVFYINLPVGIVSILMTRLFIFDPAYIRRGSARIDYGGIGLLAVGIGALQIVLDKGQEDDWFASHSITTLSIISAAALLVFLIYELRVRSPVVNLRVFKLPTYSTGVFLMTMLGFVLYGSLVLLPLFLQTLLGYPALQAGIAMAPRGVGSFIAMPIIGIIMSRFDPRKLLGVGLLSASGTLFWLSRLNLNAGYWDIFWPQFIQGIAFGLLFVPLTTITMDPIAREQMGNATSIFNLMRNIGGSVGISLATTILARREQLYINLLGGHVNPYNLQSQMTVQGLQGRLAMGGSDPLTAERQAYGILFGMVQRQAAMLSFNELFQLMGIIFLAVVPFLLLMRRPKAQAGGMPAH